MKTLYWLVGLGTLVIVLGNKNKVRDEYDDNNEVYLIVGVYVALDDVSGCVLGAWLMTVTTTSIMTLL